MKCETRRSPSERLQFTSQKPADPSGPPTECERAPPMRKPDTAASNVSHRPARHANCSTSSTPTSGRRVAHIASATSPTVASTMAACMARHSAVSRGERRLKCEVVPRHAWLTMMAISTTRVPRSTHERVSRKGASTSTRGNTHASEPRSSAIDTANLKGLSAGCTPRIGVAGRASATRHPSASAPCARAPTSRGRCSPVTTSPPWPPAAGASSCPPSPATSRAPGPSAAGT